jgi:predicted secreted protein
MVQRKSFCFVIAVLVFGGSYLWAGDNPTFVDLGFSADGKVYMYAQYGVESLVLRPWAELGVVDVPGNDFVPGGRVSYTHAQAIIPGQNGSGVLYRLLSRNSALTDRHGISFLSQGQTLYVSPETATGPETIEFRNFQTGVSYRASLNSVIEGSGNNLRSSFSISLEKTGGNGAKRSYTVGAPQIKRPLITSYGIWKVLAAPQDAALIFVIETKKPVDGGFDIRYMVEAVTL